MIKNCSHCKIEIEVADTIPLMGIDISKYGVICPACEIVRDQKIADELREETERTRNKLVNKILKFAPKKAVETGKALPNGDLLTQLKKWFMGDEWCFFLTGTVGTGKTTHACALIYGVLNNHFQFVDKLTKVDALAHLNATPSDLIAITTTDLVADVQSTYSDQKINSEDIVAKYKSCKFLVLDDLGDEKEKEDAIDIITTVLFHRHREDLKTLITSNCRDVETKYGTRIASRLSEAETFILDGNDMRLSK